MASAISTTGAARLAAPLAPCAGFVLVVAVAAAAGLLVTGADTAARAAAESGVDLTRLLRAMAAIKLLMAAGAAATVVWRLQTAVSPRAFAGYALAGAAMAAGPGLIWDMAHVLAGALLLHAGLLATIVLLWRDPAVGARLASLVAARRARR